MLAGIREILVITTPQDQGAFKELLGDGSNLGVSLTYEVQEQPKGIAQAFILGEKFLSGSNCMLILGDNIFHGNGLGQELALTVPKTGAHIYTYEVANPSEYGVLKIDSRNLPQSVYEKPKSPESNLAITGLYVFDDKVSEISKTVKPSARGELEIISVIETYLNMNELTFTQLSRGSAWLDTGNPNSLNDASNFIRIIEERTGLKIGCIEEIAFRNKWISESQLKQIANKLGTNSYASYLKSLLV
jgi:glucose-1-phosphate thymidylyltransferase